MRAGTLAKALGGHKAGAGWIARCPAHDDRKPSLSISYGRDGKVLVKCHAGCDQRNVIGTLRDHRLWADDERDHDVFRRRQDYLAAGTNTDQTEADTLKRSISSLAIWASARDLDGTPGLMYFANRGIDVQILPNLKHALRWHPFCPWELGTHGCIVALFTDIISGAPKGIHRIAVTPAGAKVDKRMLGPSAGCVIRLWPDEAVTDGLVLGEGIETTLAAATRLDHRHTRLIPAWAAGSAGNMAKFPVLAGIEALTLLVDNDASGTGQRAANECSARWTAAGREVIRLIPDTMGNDFADIVSAA